MPQVMPLPSPTFTPHLAPQLSAHVSLALTSVPPAPFSQARVSSRVSLPPTLPLPRQARRGEMHRALCTGMDVMEQIICWGVAAPSPKFPLAPGVQAPFCSSPGRRVCGKPPISKGCSGQGSLSLALTPAQ